jgi:WD40 repeat protein/serine/threonine protein kinase/tetratricopeptide (TPR) repeat protein
MSGAHGDGHAAGSVHSLHAVGSSSPGAGLPVPEHGLDLSGFGSLDASLAELVEQVTRELQAGGHVDIEALAAQNPKHAARLRELGPALADLAALGPRLKQGAIQKSAASDVRIGPGRLVGDYLLVRKLGHGGMAVVFEAVQQNLGRRVALKILPAAALVDARAMLRFQIEARAAACLQHPNIVPVYAVDLVDDLPYYAMQLIEGKSLAEVIDAMARLVNLRARGSNEEDAGVRAIADDPIVAGLLSGWPEANGDVPANGSSADRGIVGGSSSGSPLPRGGSRTGAGRSYRSPHYVRSVAKLGVQAALALEYAHGQGIIHRDIKPANLLVDKSGCLWVTDFGLARLPSDSGLTRTGELVGTIRYMSPEQADGKQALVDRRSDIYSLGATLYELLCLRPAHEGRTPNAILRHIAEAEPKELRALNPAVTGDLSTVIAKAMGKEASKRYLTAQELADDLNRFLDGRPVAARQAPLWERALKRARRRPIMTALLFLVGLLLVALVGLGIWSYRRIGKEAEAARSLARLESRARIVSQTSAAALALDRGIALADNQQISRGLFWMLRGLESAPSSAIDLRRVAAANLTLWARQAARPRFILPNANPIFALAVSPDGQTVAVGDDGGVLTLWDAVSGERLDSAQVGQDRVDAIEFHPDGSMLATTGFNEGVRLWDVRPLKQRTAALPLATRVLRRMGFDPTGRFLLTAGLDGVIVFRDARTGAPVGPTVDTIDSTVTALLGVTFRPDGRQFVTYRRDGVAQFWDTQTRRKLFAPLLHAGEVRSAKFRPDGKQLATVENRHSEGRIRIWDVTDGRLVAESARLSVGLATIAYHPAGRTIAARSFDSTLHLFDAETGQGWLAPFTHDGLVYELAFSPDGRFLAASTTDGNVWFHDAVSGRALGSTPDHGAVVSGLAFQANGRGLVSASRDGSARIWDVTPLAEPGRYLPLAEHARVAELSPDGRLIATDGRDGAARVYDVVTGHPVLPPLIHTNGQVRIATFSPDGRRLATGGDDNVVQLWDVATGAPIGRPMLQRTWPLNARFSPDGKVLLVSHAGGTAALWDTTTFRQIGPSLEHPILAGHEVWHAAFDSSGRRAMTATVLSSGSEATVEFWDTATGRSIAASVRFAESINQIVVASEPEDRLYVVSGGRVHVLDLARCAERTPAYGQRIGSIALSRDGKFVLAGGTDKTARLLDAETGAPAGPILEHDETVRGVAISPDGAMLLTLAGEQLRFWDAATGKLFGPPRVHRDLVTRIGPKDRMPVFFTQDGKGAVSVGGSVVFWDVPTRMRIDGNDNQKLVSSIRALTGMDLSDRGDYRMLDAPDWRRLLADRSGQIGAGSEGDFAEWHDRIAAESERTGHKFAARWHLDRLIAARPDDWAALARRAYARQQAGDIAGAEADRALARRAGDREQVAIWEAHQAYAGGCEAVAEGRWQAVREELGQVAKRGPATLAAMYRLAEADLRLNHWEEAEGELAAFVSRQADDVFGTWTNTICEHWLATIRLCNGHSEIYRRESARLLKQVGANPTPRGVYGAVWHASLAPGAIDDPMAAVRLAETPVGPINATISSLIHAAAGAANYRAHRYDEAINHLEEANRKWDGDRSRVLAFLAMANQALGREVEARRWLGQLMARTPTPPADWGAPWAELEVALLQREALAVVVYDPVFPADPFKR